jgi:hypothetical protein
MNADEMLMLQADTLIASAFSGDSRELAREIGGEKFELLMKGLKELNNAKEREVKGHVI